MSITVLSVCTGKVAPLFVRDGGGRTSSVMTAIRKAPVSTVAEPHAVSLAAMGLVGDETADLDVHGGREKAVYFMPEEHYPFWAEQRSRMRLEPAVLVHGSLGENLTIRGLLEENIYLGDELQIGDTVLRVTAPREPCFKFNARMGYPHAAKHMVQQGNCGWYASVATPGLIQAGMDIQIIPGPRRLSVAAEFARLNRKAQQSLF